MKKKVENANEPEIQTEVPWKLLIFIGVVLALMIACMIVIFAI